MVNIPGNDVAKGEEVATYIGSGPPEGTGLHRYIFLGELIYLVSHTLYIIVSLQCISSQDTSLTQIPSWDFLQKTEEAPKLVILQPSTTLATLWLEITIRLSGTTMSLNSMRKLDNLWTLIERTNKFNTAIMELVHSIIEMNFDLSSIQRMSRLCCSKTCYNILPQLLVKSVRSPLLTGNKTPLLSLSVAARCSISGSVAPSLSRKLSTQLSVEEKFSKDGVVPDVINKAPQHAAKVYSCVILPRYVQLFNTWLVKIHFPHRLCILQASWTLGMS